MRKLAALFAMTIALVGCGTDNTEQLTACQDALEQAQGVIDAAYVFIGAETVSEMLEAEQMLNRYDANEYHSNYDACFE